MAEWVFFKQLGCSGDNRVRFGENLLRFAKGQEPFAIEPKLKPKIKDRVENKVIVNPVKDNEVTIPFIIVERPPVFPGCENLGSSETRNCFSKKITQHIRENFYYPEELKNKGISGRVRVSFIISKNGAIKNIKTRGPNKQLEEIGYNIIQGLPKMEPASQRGGKVSVSYSLPLNFR